MKLLRFAFSGFLMLGLLTAQGCGEGSSPNAEKGGSAASAVPEHLRPALPVAKRFGFGDAGLRAEAIETASEAEIQELRQTVARFGDEIGRWLDSVDPDLAMSDDAAALLFMLLAHDEIDL
jgi:hypothetical protein